jgi:threonine/homoserine/homoserine lactone efflux protein
LLTNLLNPKMALFVLALFPQFINPQSGSIVVQMLALATVLNLIGLLVNGGVIVMASKLSQRMATSKRIGKLMNQLLGVVFLGLACRLALASRN